MKTQNKLLIKRTPFWSTFLAIVLFTFAGCSLSGVDSQNQDITQEDLEAASQIIGESLSDESSGAMSSLNDAVASFSDNGFENSTPAKSIAGSTDDDDNTGRDSESNFSYSYDPETGTHCITFTRSVNRGEFFKTVTDTLKYIFTDNNGEFIAQPRKNRNRVETIDFKGFKEGNVNLPNRTSFFVRADTFFIDGFSNASSILTIDGVHNGEGNFRGTRDNGNSVERNYDLEINFLNIEVDKEVVEANRSLEQGVTGSLTYEIHIEKVTNGSTSTKSIVGTIEFNGDGTALLRFEGFQKLFQINLDDGDVRDGDKEFEGRVAGINVDRGIVELSNTRRVRIANSTEVEFDDGLTSLEDVARALNEGEQVRAEGEGQIRDGNFIASEIEFELANSSDNANDD